MLRPSLLLLALLSYASPALAAWGENWGVMVWGAAAPSAVPMMDGLGLGLLVLALIGLAIRGLRSRATLGLIVLASFMGVADLAEAQVTIAFAAGTSSANESNAETLVQVTLSTGGATLVAPVSVNVALGSGSATIPDDYMLSSSSLFFPAGSGDGTA
ncbi:MAG: hypothetical protein ABGX04_15405, partial [Myxococcales bacterium]